MAPRPFLPVLLAAALAASASAAGAAPAAGGVSLSGLTLPISTTWDEAGNVFVLEKAGRVKAIRSWVGVPTRVVLDISKTVASYGDHGATSVLFDEGYLYVTYMKVNPKWGPDCKDYGQIDGRPRGNIEGCAAHGRLSRWAMDAGGSGSVVGQEEVLFDTEPGNRACVQFSTHSTPACVVKHNGAFYISLGDGAAFTTIDPGDLGQNECGDTPPFTGAFRSQDPQRLNGKVLRLDPVSFAPTVVTKGHRNPFRLSVVADEVHATETGWYTYEEINRITGPGRGGGGVATNLGWPCREGPAPTPEYGGDPRCANFNLSGFVDPVYAYVHPLIVAPMVSSISALAGFGTPPRAFFADFVFGWVRSIDATSWDPAGILTHANNHAVVELKVTPDNALVAVDHTGGFVFAVDASLSGSGVPSALPLPPPTASIIPLSPTFVPYVGTVTLGSTSNVAGREGAAYSWAVVALWNCGAQGPAQTCDWTWLFSSTVGASLTMNSPYLLGPGKPATLEVQLTVNTAKGASQGLAGATAIAQVGVAGAPLCTCGGVRTNNNAMPPAPASAVVDSSATPGQLTLRKLLPPPPAPAQYVTAQGFW